MALNEIKDNIAVTFKSASQVAYDLVIGCYDIHSRIGDFGLEKNQNSLNFFG